MHIPMPHPMHSLPQLLRQLLRIRLNTRRAHREKQSRLPARLDDTLSARTANLIIGIEDIGNLLEVRGRGSVGEEVLEDEGVFERLAGTLSLPGGSGVSGIAEQRDAAFEVCRGQCVIQDCPFS